MLNNFQQLAENYVKGAQEILNSHYATSFPSLKPDTLELTYGKRYAKVVRKTHRQSGGSVYAFLDMETGDVLKPASWAKPAKHARGNLLDESGGLAKTGPYGPNYLR